MPSEYIQFSPEKMTLFIHPRVKMARRKRVHPGLLGLLCILLLIAPCMSAPASSSDQQQNTRQEANQILHIPQIPVPPSKSPEEIPTPKRIAIIGGGIGGLSTAHYLKNDETQSNLTRIRVLEREPRIGGRIRTVTPYGKYGKGLVEIGGDLFHEDDCLVAEMARSLDSRSGNLFPGSFSFSFSHDEVNPVSMASLWDGQDLKINPVGITTKIPFTRETLIKTIREEGGSLRFWERFAHSLWRNWKLGMDLPGTWFGTPLFRCDKWEEVFAWASIQARPPLDQQMLESLAPRFGFNSTMQRAVECGNETLLNRLLHRLNQQPGFSLDVNSTVTRVTRNEDQTFDVEWSRQFPERTHNNIERFDAVVIAAPFHQTDTEVDPPLPVEPEKVEYSPLHVTNFIARQPLDGRNFNLHADSPIPEVIWNVDESPKTNRSSTSPSFLSITKTDLYEQGGDDAYIESLYRIISREPFSDHNITALLDVFGKTRENITFPDQPCYENEGGMRWLWSNESGNYVRPPKVPQHALVGDLVAYPSACLRTESTVRWLHRQYWPYGMPVVRPESVLRDGAEQLELTPGMFYLSGFEGWQGASMSQSVSNAKQVATTLLSL